ncbi:hypothetical protein PVA17_21610 [Lysinibacillus sp. CNPSo 3705]|uniref:hypothetical protein n=1 Tax=Lysinibacillus sp. CNPSo 3705 TaxID=3028148 RepID=UPI0023647549|nr:hypothetical protein [Lysinibacillus sp. CNPSo 3705]MDD1505321.1 hypothetical protein [Lysinibacillus sp. CNPSo 3705]
MKQVHLISVAEKETDNWSKLIELAGNNNIKVIDINNSKMENLKAISTGIAWIVGTGMHPDLLDKVIKYCQGHSIPVVCTDCSHIRNYSVQDLISIGVKAIVNLHFSVLRIQEVMNIVQGGGIYMENMSKTNAN